MDWRNRKYYIATFSLEAIDMRISTLKSVLGARIHFQNKYTDSTLCDETEPRGHYQVLIGCNYKDSEAVEYELRKAERNDKYCVWKEIKRDISKKYFDIYGQEMPYRRCDIHHNKRCNRCMDC